MLPGKKMDPLTQIELDAEQRAQEFKRRLIKEGMERLAAEQSAALSPPEGDGLRPGSDPSADADDDGRRGDR